MQYRYEGNIFSGEKRTELLVVPALSVRVSPRSRDRSGVVDPRAPATARGAAAAAAPGSAPRRGAGIRAATAAGEPREIRVTVVNDTPGARDSVVKLELPHGWTRDAGRAAGQVRARGRIADACGSR